MNWFLYKLYLYSYNFDLFCRAKTAVCGEHRLYLGSTYEKDTFTFLLYLLIFRNWSPNYLDLVLLGCRKKSSFSLVNGRAETKYYPCMYINALLA
jgi:hypothetical protein